MYNLWQALGWAEQVTTTGETVRYGVRYLLFELREGGHGIDGH